ncbi:MAG: chorismate synthase [Clostridia bacterium]|nr:chorismate synthase [Clostridia bacterium]
MNSNFGEKIVLSIFGESHGAAIGGVLTGLPKGIKIDFDEMEIQRLRRAPGRDKTATPRKETDEFEILSGVLDGKTTGAPLALIIRNGDTISKNYDNLRDCPRPSHSDYAAAVKFGGMNDVRGGGHFSGRLTAPITALGTICRTALLEKGITVGGHILKIGAVNDSEFDKVNISAKQLSVLNKAAFPVIDSKAEEKMRAVIEAARQNCDSVGGMVEIAVTGLPAGLGNPMFKGIENVIASALYGIPAVKAVSFGAGFDFADMLGSEANDALYYDKNGNIKTKTNNCGGILGGITNGMPLIIRVALKPTPSISKPQQTVNLKTKENVTLTVEGRHDPCIVPRALPALEAMLCVALADILAGEGKF